jgi:hypothetical protein
MAINISKIEYNNVRSCSQTPKQAHKKPAFGLEMKNPRLINRVMNLSDSFTSAQQRLWMGITAILIQPFMDLHNKKVDKDTRQVSCSRTMGKILAGTLTGVSIRYGCITILDRWCKTDATEAAKAAKKGVEYVKGEIKPSEQRLLPKIGRELTLEEIKRYKNAFGTLAATFIMVFTNFLIDAPLTTALTNVFVKMFRKGKGTNKTAQEKLPEKDVKPQKGDS